MPKFIWILKDFKDRIPDQERVMYLESYLLKMANSEINSSIEDDNKKQRIADFEQKKAKNAN